MFKRILQLLAPVALLALIPAPALAQPAQLRLEIRIAQSAPPRARHESKPPRPDRDSVWIKGYWHWEGVRWDWVIGRWERPEQHTYRWVAPRYVHEGAIWRYEPPHWSHQQLVEGDEYRHWKDEHHR